VTIEEHAVLIEVADRSATPPARERSPGVAGGYGMRIVEQASDAWGSTLTTSGKTVWARISTVASTASA
jgi:hypothetical protein